MKDIMLKVAKAYPNDSARGIARLDPNALLTLRLSPGDIIEIEGKRLTAAKVWRADQTGLVPGLHPHRRLHPPKRRRGHWR